MDPKSVIDHENLSFPNQRLWYMYRGTACGHHGNMGDPSEHNVQSFVSSIAQAYELHKDVETMDSSARTLQSKKTSDTDCSEMTT